MAFIPVNHVVMLELFQSLHGEQIENTLYFQLPTAPGPSEAASLWNAMLLWWSIQLAPSLSQDLTLRAGKITDLTSATGFASDFAAPTPNPAGGVAADAEPGNVAICVSFRTLSRGRSYRGRNYVGGLSETRVHGNTLESATALDIQSAYQAIPAIAFADPWVWGVVSRFTAGAPRAAGVFTPITDAVVVDFNIDSMRGRLAGRGT